MTTPEPPSVGQHVPALEQPAHDDPASGRRLQARLPAVRAETFDLAGPREVDPHGGTHLSGGGPGADAGLQQRGGRREHTTRQRREAANGRRSATALWRQLQRHTDRPPAAREDDLNPLPASPNLED